MNIAELKLKFFRQIDSLDEDNLEQAYGVLLNYINSKDDLDEWSNLTSEQQKGIIDSIEQLENNQGISHKEVIKKYKISIMPREIIWSPLADEDLDDILEYLAEEWNQEVIIRFINKIDLVTEQVAKIPNQYPIINRKLQVRKCVVTKQNTLFYREIENKIEILRLYDTRQDPKKLKFK